MTNVVIYSLLFWCLKSKFGPSKVNPSMVVTICTSCGIKVRHFRDQFNVLKRDHQANSKAITFGRQEDPLNGI